MSEYDDAIEYEIKDLRTRSLAVKAKSLKSMKRFRVALPLIQGLVSLMQLSSVHATIADGRFIMASIFVLMYFLTMGLAVYYWKTFDRRIRKHVAENVVARLKGEFPYDNVATGT